MRKSFVVVALTSTLLLTACATGGPNETGGTLLGAAGGALIGSQVGGGSGRIVGAAVGTLGGALIGKTIGRNMDDKNKKD